MRRSIAVGHPPRRLLLEARPQGFPVLVEEAARPAQHDVEQSLVATVFGGGRSALPASGASGTVSRPRRTCSSSAPWTSSFVKRVRELNGDVGHVAGDDLGVRRVGEPGSQAPAMCASRRRALMVSGLRKFSWTNAPSVSPNLSFRSTMTAVCGIGTPSG